MAIILFLLKKFSKVKKSIQINIYVYNYICLNVIIYIYNHLWDNMHFKKLITNIIRILKIYSNRKFNKLSNKFNINIYLCFNFQIN